MEPLPGGVSHRIDGMRAGRWSAGCYSPLRTVRLPKPQNTVNSNRKAPLAKADGLVAQLLLRLRFQFACISFFMHDFIAQIDIVCHI